MMTIEIVDAVLPFSIASLVKVLPYLCALSFCILVMSIDVRNNNGEHLSSISELRRALAGRVTRASQHDVRVAQVHLDPAYRVAVPIVLRKSEYAREPVTGLRHVAVYQMRKDGRGWHRTVIHTHTMIRICSRSSMRFFAVPAESAPHRKGSCTGLAKNFL